MTPLIFVCLATFFSLLHLLRRDRVSLGLPIAYLYSLLLIGVPGILPMSSAVISFSIRIWLRLACVSWQSGRCALSRACGWPVPRRLKSQSVRRLISIGFGGFACSAGGLASTGSAPSTRFPVSALPLIRREGFGCWACCSACEWRSSVAIANG